MTLEDGTELSPALGIGAFAEKTLVAAGQCTKVDPAADPAVVGLLGCGVMAGIGAAINTGNVGRGDSVAVIGCGGVGDAAIVGVAAGRRARRSSRSTVDDREAGVGRGTRRHPHRQRAEVDDVVEAIQELTGGFGADVVIDAVGRPETYKQAFYARDLAGTVVLVGVPTPDMTLELPLLDFFGRGGSLKSSWYGDCLPERDFPMLDRPVPAGPPAAGRSSSPRRSRSTTSRRRSRRCTAARCCARWWSCDRRAARRPRRHLGHVRLDGGTWDVDNNVWLVGDDNEVLVDRRRARRAQPIVDAVGGRQRGRRSCAPTATTTTSTRAPELAERTDAPILLHPADDVAVGA